MYCGVRRSSYGCTPAGASASAAHGPVRWKDYPGPVVKKDLAGPKLWAARFIGDKWNVLVIFLHDRIRAELDE